MQREIQAFRKKREEKKRLEKVTQNNDRDRVRTGWRGNKVGVTRPTMRTEGLERSKMQVVEILICKPFQTQIS